MSDEKPHPYRIDIDKASKAVTRGDLFTILSLFHQVANLHQMALISLKDGTLDELRSEVEAASGKLGELFQLLMDFIATREDAGGER